MGRVGTRSNGIFTLIPTVPHVRNRKCFLVVETPKTLCQKVQKVEKFQNSKNSHEQTRIRVSTCIYMYAYVYTAATCIYAFSCGQWRGNWKSRKFPTPSLKIEFMEIPKIPHSIVLPHCQIRYTATKACVKYDTQQPRPVRNYMKMA